MTSDDARSILDELHAKLAKASARMVAIQTESQSLSLGALTGDAKARKRLDELNRECATHEIETRNIKSAIEAQKAIIAAAQAEDDLQQKIFVSREVKKIAERLRQRGRQLGDAFAAVRQDAAGLEADLKEARHLGVMHPAASNIWPFLEIALVNSLRGSLLQRAIENAGKYPNRTTDFAKVADDWALSLERQADAIVVDKAEAA
jgi:hypothetical protein